MKPCFSDKNEIKIRCQEQDIQKTTTCIPSCIRVIVSCGEAEEGLLSHVPFGSFQIVYPRSVAIGGSVQFRMMEVLGHSNGGQVVPSER